MSALVFALPSKGRLKEQAEAFLANCGLGLTAIARGYAAHIPALPDIEVRLLSSAEIAAALREGRVHAGVAGEDLLRETEPSLTRITLVRPLGFGFADLVVAAPQSWIDVATMADLDAVCHAFRAQSGRRLRVATKYLALTRAFFDARGLDDYRIVESQGATEGAPASGAAEIIVDITTTGATLAANHLKILKDGLILPSQAHIAASRAAPWSAPTLAVFARLLDVIEARARAETTRLLNVAAEPAAQAAICARAVELGCTPSRSAGAGGLVFECAASSAAAAGAALIEAGAAAVSVVAPDYVFKPENPALQRFKAGLSPSP